MGIQDSHDGMVFFNGKLVGTDGRLKQMAASFMRAGESAASLRDAMNGAAAKFQFKMDPETLAVLMGISVEEAREQIEKSTRHNLKRSLSYDEAKRIIAQARHNVLLRPETSKWLLHSSYLGLNGHSKFREAVRQEVENLQPRGSEYLPLYHFMTNTWNIDGRNISDEMFDFLNLGEGTRPAMDDDRARPIVDENGLPYTRSGSVEWGVTPDNAAKHEFIQVVQCATGCGILVPSDGSEREPICEQCVVEMDAEDNL